jgi:hypothetical protein
MADVKNVTLQILPASSDSQRKVTVGFTVAFNNSEAGKTFRYGINLRGEDKSGDDEGTLVSSGQVLYTFKFSNILKPLDHKTITAQAGEQSFTETRDVSIEKLDEDPGVTVIQPGLGTTIKLPHPDEVYATVHLVASEERSPALTLVL